MTGHTAVGSLVNALDVGEVADVDGLSRASEIDHDVPDLILGLKRSGRLDGRFAALSWHRTGIMDHVAALKRLLFQHRSGVKEYWERRSREPFTRSPPSAHQSVFCRTTRIRRITDSIRSE